MRRITLLGFVVACAGCTPSRDNPNDPQNAPFVDFHVAALPPGADCARTDGWAEVAAVSRGQCIALDARGSLGQQQAPIHDFTFFLDGDSAPIAPAVQPTAGLAVLSSAFVRSLPVQAGLRFRVVVHDARGRYGTGTADVVLQNARPIAAVDGGWRLPVGGRPWDTSTSATLHFSAAASRDPDQDPILQYRWTLGAIVTTTAAPSFSPVVDDGVARHLHGSVEAFDGADWSRPAFFDVDVGAPDIWSLLGSIPLGTKLVQFDEVRAAPSLAAVQSAFPQVQWLSGPGGSRIAVTEYGGNATEIALYDFHAGTTLDDVKFDQSGPGNIRSGASSDGGVVWVNVKKNNGAEFLEPLTLAVDSNSFVQGQQIPLSTHSLPSRVAVDAAGRPWVSYTGTNQVLGLAGTAPALAPAPLASGLALRAIAARPSHAELWAAFSPALSGTAELVVYTDAAAAPVEYVLSSADVQGVRDIAFDGADSLWILDDAGVRLVDVPSFLAGAGGEPRLQLAAATVATGALTGGLEIWADPQRDVAFVFLETGDVTEFDATGTRLTTWPDADATMIDAVDEEGTYWTSVRFSLVGAQGFGRPFRRVRVPASDGVIRYFATPQVVSLAAADLEEGGAWVISGGLMQIAPDGIVRRTFTAVLDTAGQAMPFPSNAVVDPDGSHAWAMANGRLLRYDLSTDPPTPAAPIATPSTGGPFAVLASGAPLPAATPFAWLKSFSSTQGLLIASDAGVTPVFSVPAGEVNSVFTRATGTNDVCVVTVDSATSTTVRVRSFTPGGTLSNVQTIVSATAVSIAGSASWDSTGTICWVAYHDTSGATPTCGAGTTHVRAFRPNGTLVASRDLSSTSMNAAYSNPLLGVGANEFWLEAGRCFPDRNTVLHETILPALESEANTPVATGFAPR